MDIQPYTIDVPTEHIDRLKQRLALSIFPDELDEAGWDYGAPLKDVKRLAEYWQNDFDWKAQEAKLNELPNYQAKVPVRGFGELDIHFVHQKSSVENAIPLLFVHGWPGHFLEVTKILSLLTSPTDATSLSFHVVAPSLPNFGFSQGVKQRGFGLAQYAETCHNLMQALGYTHYVTQGGDWGFYITRTISLLYPSACAATHINMIRADAPSWTSQPALAAKHALTPYTDSEKAGLERTKWFLTEGNGYRLQQTTKPQTLGYGIADSPVALLAWVYEKLVDWTDGYSWTDEEVCTWVSIYALSTAGPTASLRIYYEAVHPPPSLSDPPLPFVSKDRTSQWISSTKIGVAHFPKDLGVVPRTWAHTLGNVVFEREHEKGGHFAAWEVPEVLVGDVREMFGRGGPCEGVVWGREGYA